MQHRDHGARFPVPASHQGDEVRRGAGIDGGEGLIQQDQRRVLQQHPCEQRTLELAAGQRPDAAPLEARQAHRRQRRADIPALGPPQPAEGSGAMPQPERNELAHADRKAEVQRPLLGQIGDAPALDTGELDAPAQGP